MKEVPALSIYTIRSVLAGSAALGADLAAMRAAADLDDQELADLDGRVPLEAGWRILDVAVETSKDDALGLHLAELAAFTPHEVLHYAGKSCADVRAVLELSSRYFRLVNALATIDVVDQGETVLLRHRLLGELRSPPRQAIECALAVMVVRPRVLVGPSFAPREVHFRHAKPASTAEHERIFQCPIRFGSAENQLVVDRRMLDLPNTTAADPRLFALLERHIEGLVAKTPEPETLLVRTRRAIVEAFRGEEVHIEEVAAKLHVSARSLQRRLAEEGTSFSELVKTLRRELAASYLGEDQLPIGEVAFLLGFSEVSSFHRAFKGWYGMTPLEFRRAARERRGAA